MLFLWGCSVMAVKTHLVSVLLLAAALSLATDQEGMCMGESVLEWGSALTGA